MHAAAFRYSLCSFTLIGWLEPGPGPPPGISLLHAFCAELNLGFPVMPGVTLTATFTSLPLVVTFGSGKFGTPCSRMHAEYATAWLSGEAEPLCELPALEDPTCAQQRKRCDPHSQSYRFHLVVSSRLLDAACEAVLRDRRLHHGDRSCHRAVTADAPRCVVHASAIGRGSRRACRHGRHGAAPRGHGSRRRARRHRRARAPGTHRLRRARARP